jgi:hypothetical protein
MLPDKIFFTGVPGSKWSGISQELERLDGINTSDHDDSRFYDAHLDGFTGHRGAYFGEGMERKPLLEENHINSAWSQPGGTRIVKSHNWAVKLDEVASAFPNDWIMLVYRPDMVSFAWWYKAGGFDIAYPNYQEYRDESGMMAGISQQNQAMLVWANQHDLQWSSFNSRWIRENFGQPLEITRTWPDVLVTLYKGKTNA